LHPLIPPDRKSELLAQLAKQALDRLRRGDGPIRPLRQLAADPHPQSVSERLLLLGWLFERRDARGRAPRWLLPPELRRWLPRPPALADLGAAPAPARPPILRAAATIVLASAEHPLAVRADGRLRRTAMRMLAERLAPLMAAALLDDKQTKVLAELLQSWDFQDSQQEAAPLVFQSLLRHYARRVVQDELGEELAAQYLNDYYYWHERIADITMANSSAWLDDKSTAELETREDLFRLAGHDALSELTSQYGPDPSAWRWGDAHTITFKHPLIPGKWAADWLGGGTHPVSGSGETLNRAAYTYGKPYETTFFSSMRFVADLSDPDKVVAHIPGGATERLFNPHMKNQLPAWLDGRPQYWWFSDAAIEQHIQSELRLTP